MGRGPVIFFKLEMCDPQQGVCGTAEIFLDQPLERGNRGVVLPTIEQPERLGICWALGHRGCYSTLARSTRSDTFTRWEKRGSTSLASPKGKRAVPR